MKTFMKYVLTFTLCIGLVSTVYAQAPGNDHVTIPLSDPSRPGTVKVNIFTGSISVKGYTGKEIIMDAKGREGRGSQPRREVDTEGLKRISTTRLMVEEDNNTVSIGSGSFSHPMDITLQVPEHTTLLLKTFNAGDIVVENVQGEIEATNTNGGVTLDRVSGSVVAHSLNGNVKATLVSVDPDKPMAFSSLNGNIDVSFPADLKADVSMKTNNGDIFSGFDIKINPSTGRIRAEESPGQGGGFKMKIDGTVRGTINGGGPEMQLNTFNGNIYIRRLTK